MKKRLNARHLRYRKWKNRFPAKFQKGMRSTKRSNK